MGRVQVWASQLNANDLPPVCAMTGRPAETWRKVRFTTVPDTRRHWVDQALRERAIAVRLPLTLAANRKLVLVTSIPVGFIVSGVFLALVSLPIGLSSVAGGILLVQGLFTMVAAGMVLLVIRPFIGPQGRVLEQRPGETDAAIELRNVHPTFMTAVNHMQPAEHTNARPTPFLPSSK